MVIISVYLRHWTNVRWSSYQRLQLLCAKTIKECPEVTQKKMLHFLLINCYFLNVILLVSYCIVACGFCPVCNMHLSWYTKEENNTLVSLKNYYVRGLNSVYNQIWFEKRTVKYYNGWILVLTISFYEN